MNKQEVIDKLKAAIPKNNIDDYQRGKVAGLNFALLLLAELDEFVRPPEPKPLEPEKPVVPQFVADWYEEHKDNFAYSVQCLCVQGCEPVRQIDIWFDNDDNKPIVTLVKMKLFGYEVEKEKLYTVKFVTEDFGKIYIGLFKNYKKLGIISLVSNDDELRTHFNEEELKRFKFWDNPAFEIKKVKE